MYFFEQVVVMVNPSPTPSPVHSPPSSSPSTLSPSSYAKDQPRRRSSYSSPTNFVQYNNGPVPGQNGHRINRSKSPH